ncbi:DegT/DnrJ/EryC1/StrS family aminotransferase [uncultured Cohaesibacter sp.]|uniref:DegT/DnrJ/EryC1/StrS family aminotransferase n=1 Tax=uncultured Cohaesibacter sp. TaxID=1002546 RepID=UPI0029C611C0|nr:DegT/DnrJ/EryC1/StrS family aminotransferase [uncultured Cohaesibacter sp.]
MSSKFSSKPLARSLYSGMTPPINGSDPSGQEPTQDAIDLLHAHFRGCHVHLASGWSTALYAAFLVLGLGPDDEVILPALAPVGIAHAVQLTGARPVFVDVSHDRLLLSLEAVATALTDKTRIVVVSHLYGQIARTEALNTLLKDRGIAIVEDGSDAFTALGTLEAPAEHCDMLVACLPGLRESEGDLPGFIVTRTQRYHQLLDIWTRQTDVSERIFSEEDPEMPEAPFIDLIAGLNLVDDKRLCHALNSLPDLQQTIDQQVALYDELLDGLPVRRLGTRTESPRHLVSYPIHIQAQHRDGLFEKIRLEGFEVYRSYRNLSELQFFSRQVSQPICPVASKWSYGAFSLPTGPHIGRREQHFLVQSVKNYFEQT